LVDEDHWRRRMGGQNQTLTNTAHPACCTLLISILPGGPVLPVHMDGADGQLVLRRYYYLDAPTFPALGGATVTLTKYGIGGVGSQILATAVVGASASEPLSTPSTLLSTRTSAARGCRKANKNV